MLLVLSIVPVICMIICYVFAIWDFFTDTASWKKIILNSILHLWSCLWQLISHRPTITVWPAPLRCHQSFADFLLVNWGKDVERKLALPRLWALWPCSKTTRLCAWGNLVHSSPLDPHLNEVRLSMHYVVWMSLCAALSLRRMGFIVMAKRHLCLLPLEKDCRWPVWMRRYLQKASFVSHSMQFWRNLNCKRNRLRLCDVSYRSPAQCETQAHFECSKTSGTLLKT